MGEFYKRKLGNGVTVLFEKREIDAVSVCAGVKFGSGHESEGEKGIAHFMEHLMFKGTETRGQEEIAREIEKKGGILNAYTAEDVTCYWAKLPSRHFKFGAEIVSDLILNPKFDTAEFEKEKKVILEEIKMYHDNPRYYVMDKIKEMLYRKPFGMSAIGTAKIVSGLTREQIVEKFDENYKEREKILSAVGNADFEEICEIAGKIFPKSSKKAGSHEAVKINNEVVERRSGLEQAHFVMGFHAPTMKTRERYAYEVLGAYLFEGMSSKLWQEIREKRGLAYAVSGSFEFGRDYGYGAIYVGTVEEKIKEIKKIIIEEIKRAREIQKEDFEECKEQMIGLRDVSEEESVNVMNSLLMEEIGGGAEDYYKYKENINSVRIEDVKNILIKNYSSFSLVPE